MTGKTFKDGKTLMCKPWNDARGCSEPCPNEAKHGCDILTAKDQACEGNHKQTQHTDPIFGYLRQ